MASGTIKKTEIERYGFSKDSGNTTTTTTDGIVDTLDIVLEAIQGQVVNINAFDLRMREVSVNVNPVITITNPAFSNFNVFVFSFPPGIRGAAGNPTISNGGTITHDSASSNIYVRFYNYFANRPAGYIHSTK